MKLTPLSLVANIVCDHVTNGQFVSKINLQIVL